MTKAIEGLARQRVRAKNSPQSSGGARAEPTAQWDPVHAVDHEATERAPRLVEHHSRRAHDEIVTVDGELTRSLAVDPPPSSPGTHRKRCLR